MTNEIETKYTPRIAEISYQGQHPEIIEFAKPWESCIRVSQGSGKLSKDGKPLQSEGFGQCFALLIRNKKTLESALFHIDGIDLSGRESRQEAIMKEFMQDYLSGLNLSQIEKEKLKNASAEISRYWFPENMRREDFQNRMHELNAENIVQGQFVFGDISRDYVKGRIVKSLLNYLGIKIAEDIKVNTKKIHWAIVYKPKESTILVDASNDKKVLSYFF